MNICCVNTPHAKGLCRSCYTKKWYAEKRLDPAYMQSSRVRSRQWGKSNPEKSKAYSFKKNLKKYNLTPEQYNALLAQQNNACKLCNKPETIITHKKTVRLAVDHDHITGQVRGLLCFKCNTSIAQFETNLEILSKVARYLGVSI